MPNSVAVSRLLYQHAALVPIESISPALVAALAAAIVSENTNSLVPVPLAYDNV